ncbi:Clavaminate synthase-like protein [Obba rivulosa]|uniref:Clavaminate synthase-like protein n=1 Tax=Obba rivulosa TaxID=1052685 RepID=A0A8E2DID1_9APHY|nr:Clavaminate synthase-like protein [Obba rivulosa]
MPTAVLPQIPLYEPAPATNEPLDYADLAVIDLSKANTPEGRAELAVQVRDAMHTQGFFYVINHGLMPSQNARMFDIADAAFSQVTEDEKKILTSDFKITGAYEGYKLRRVWHIDSGVRDQIEQYNIHRHVRTQAHPKALTPLLPELDAFARFNHFEVLHPILRLFALGLELPEDTFVNMHNFDGPGDTSLRFMKYYPRSEDEEIATKNVWLKGHADIGSVSILWSQRVGGLQILSSDGNWRWVRHIENALVINAGDSMDFLSGGFYKPTIHRVTQPPADQRNYARLGIFYFSKPDDDVKLIPLSASPVLQRNGIKRRCDDADAPTAGEWRKGVTSAYGMTNLKKTESGVEEEVISGIVVKHYN